MGRVTLLCPRLGFLDQVALLLTLEAKRGERGGGERWRPKCVCVCVCERESE